MPDITKRFELRLSPDHPIWSYPAGERNRVARDWLDLGSRMMSLEAAMHRITEQLEPLAAARTVQSSTNNDNGERLKMDKDDFLSAFGK